ncbi:phage tail tube protein [Hansschlegelia beijingensis]|uniref:Phage tail protein n=1 Tax=Hansschlegelia beijingensis TaxID=1133344 RepID=A0A7W6GED9_9HYPH|nr:phage tail tube protein [Hansschlegelia beijingensis]MBB3972781.1 hypothetical protein [Hansschlegelia beijingensis]
MADDKIRRGTLLTIKVGDGASPEVFTKICGLQTKSFNQSANMSEHVPTNCANPDAVKAVRRIKQSKGAELTGSGYFLSENRATLQVLFDSPDASNVRIAVEVPLADGGGWYEGLFHLSTFSVTGGDETMLEAEMTWQSDGDYAWTDATA